jgi:hypothetical protein
MTLKAHRGRTVQPMIYLSPRGVGYNCKSVAYLNIIRNKVIILPRINQFLFKIKRKKKRKFLNMSHVDNYFLKLPRGYHVTGLRSPVFSSRPVQFCSVGIRTCDGAAGKLSILQNRHEYGPMNTTMHLIKPITNPSLLLPYEQLHITDLSKRGQLIPEQNAYDSNPLVSLVLAPSTNPRNTQPVK